MSFREKSAWITLLSVLLCFGVYYGTMLTGQVATHGAVRFLLFVGCVIGLAVLQAGLHIVAAVLSPKEAQAPRDERERLIDARAHTFGYYVLVTGVLALAVPGHLGHDVIDLMNFALLAVVVATLAVTVAQIVMYRRGA